MSTTDDQISRMKADIGVRSDRKLAEMLGLTAQAVTNWRNRDSVPESALSRFRAMRLAVMRHRLLQDRREELGNQVLYEGRCLALFLAPSLDAFGARYTAVDHYTGELRDYASFWPEIETACAEEIATQLSQIEGNATNAFEMLALADDKNALRERILARARWWRFGDLERKEM